MTEGGTIEDQVAAITGGRHQGLRLAGERLSLLLDVAGLGMAERRDFERVVRDRLAALEGVGEVVVGLTAERSAPRLVAIASGKGGVGKSTLAANLAVALARMGRPTGLVDADIYGPSQPRLLNREGVKPEAADKKLVPVATEFGVPFLSMGQLVKEGQAIAWRGPMAGNALGQLIDAEWGNVRDLIVDLPPGTGDVQLTMVQRHKPAGALIVSTPQDLALIDAARAVHLFRQAGVPIIGLVENMAGYVCPHCGEASEPFGHGGAEAAAANMGLAFLGRVPLMPAIREASDAGAPPAAGEGAAAAAFADIAVRLATWLDNR